MTAPARARRFDERDRRSVTINLRVSVHLRDLIDRAANVIGKTRSDFMLDTARERAEDVLLDQTLFGLDNKRYAEFLKLLDEPAPPGDRLRGLLSEKAPWEK